MRKTDKERQFFLVLWEFYVFPSYFKLVLFFFSQTFSSLPTKIFLLVHSGNVLSWRSKSILFLLFRSFWLEWKFNCNIFILTRELCQGRGRAAICARVGGVWEGGGSVCNHHNDRVSYRLLCLQPRGLNIQKSCFRKDVSRILLLNVMLQQVEI